MSPIRLVFPMSGQGTRYKKVGYTQPKPLIPVLGKPMIEHLLNQFPVDWPCTFIIAENHQATELPQLLQKLRPGCDILTVPQHSEGPGRPLQVALEKLMLDSRQDEPLLVSYCDYSMIWDPRKFSEMVQATRCDAALVSYTGFHAHYLSPVTYAYSRLQGERVVEVKEKGSFTAHRENEFASCGAYYFKNCSVLKEALDFQYKNQIRLNGEYYTSLTVQALLLARPSAHVRVFEIPYFFQWGTPEDLWDFEYWAKTFKASRSKSSELQVDQLLMPMAGLGSRFKALTSTPKPFITVAGKPIYKKALQSLPKAKLQAIVALKEHSEFLPASSPSGLESAQLKSTALQASNTDFQPMECYKFLQETPPGQALTTKEGLSLLDPQKSVLISACDHQLFIPNKNWNQVMKEKPDAVIFTVKGFPGCRRNPKAFAYVEPKDSQAPVCEVKSVSVKVPFSEEPSKDHLLVGTFWFQKVHELNELIQDLIDQNLQVNGELYLDSVLNLYLKKNKKVFLCQCDGYINWGDPDSMAEALYWTEVHQGPKRIRRGRYSGVFK